MIWQAFSDGLSVFVEKWPVVLIAVGVTSLGWSLSLFLLRNTSKEITSPWQSLGLLIGFFAVSVILRLAFLTETLVPPYFDSVEHYRIIKELVTAMDSSSLLETLPSLTPGYYHLGFHFLASLLTFGLPANLMDMILVLGQVILAAIPIPLFFLIRGETKSNAAAFFGTLLAGFGWYMPGFAVNWGKYPALAGLLALEIVLSMAYFISLKKSNRNQPLWIGLLILGIMVSTLFHTRTLIVIVISFISWLISGELGSLSKKFQYLSMGILLMGLLILGIQIKQEPLLTLTLEPYFKDGLWVTLTVVALSPFALAKFPRSVCFSILFTLSVFVALFVPIGNWLPGLENQTLLDRPFVEMLLYLPLSMLGGLGLGGLLQFLNDIKGFSEQINQYVRILAAVVFLGIASLTPVRNYNFYPSDCCNFVKYDDTIALDWLEANLPADAYILIPATQMNVLPSGPSAGLTGTDAGIWIPALTGKAITYAQFEIDFHSESTLEMLCQLQIDYVYIGGTSQSFNVSQLLAKGNWYEAVLSLPDAQVYRLIGC
ncbi:MAG: hypothetical protein WBL25_13970 [Anaerolineales bacterium]